MASTNDQRGIHLLAEEQLSAGHDGFLDSIRSLHEPKALAALADKWKHDPRPWAKTIMQRYALMPFDQQGHQVMVKRLFKQAEARGDDALMAAFLTAFDRLVRRQRTTGFRFDRDLGRYVSGEHLSAPRNVFPSQPAKTLNPKSGKPMTYAPRVTAKHRLFKHRTRYYLQRRVWRYFRKLGFTDGPRFLSAITNTLLQFNDADLSAGEHLIDSWSLMHALYGESDAVEFSSLRTCLKEGRSLAELQPSPVFPKHWRTENGVRAALAIIIGAQSQLVRAWALAWHRELAKTIAAVPTTDELMRMLSHASEEVQSYGASLILNAPDAAHWTLDTWLRLLTTDNPSIAQLLCDAMLKHVTESRLDLAQCVGLAKSKAVPIARTGLQFLRSRKIQSVEHRAAISELARAQCLGIGNEIAQWALGILGQADVYQMPMVCRFFDSANASVRMGAWNWLTSDGSASWQDASLWSRLVETPYEDVRLRMIDALSMRANAPKLAANDLAPMWSAVLLGVNRGGRQKLRAARQIADALAEHPDQHEKLLPVLVTAVRSIRGPEARAALSSVLSILARQPSLEAVVVAALPELNLNPALEVAA